MKCFFKIISFAVMMIFLSACSQQVVEGIQRPLVTSTWLIETSLTSTAPIPNKTLVPSISPSHTSTPIRTVLPTSTQSPTLYPNEPYLIFLDKSDFRAFIALGSNSFSKVRFELPQDSCVYNWPNAIAPRGHWMAIYMNCSHEEISSDLSLNLLHIPDGEIRPITQLFINEDAINPQEVGNDIYVLDWSPDGRYLAFSGVIESPYLDLYIYDLDDDSIRRLTNNLQKLDYLKWSPDNKWLWFENSEWEGAYSRTYSYAIQASSSEIQNPKALLDGLWFINERWVTSNEYFLVNSSEGCCGPYNLRYINVDSGQVKVLWKSFTMGYAIDSEQRSIIVSAAPESDQQGTFIIKWSGEQEKISDQLWGLEYRGGSDSRFIGFNRDGIVAIDQDGSITEISTKPFHQLSVSPNNSWFVLYDGYSKVPGMDLYSGNDQFVGNIIEDYAFPVAWLPDATGLFYMAENLYFVDIPEGDPVLIEECRENECGHWVGMHAFMWSFP